MALRPGVNLGPLIPRKLLELESPNFTYILMESGSGGSSPGPGGHAPRWRPGNFFRQYIDIITKPTAYDGLVARIFNSWSVAALTVS